MENKKLTIKQLQEKCDDLNRALTVALAQKDLLESELNFFWLFDKDEEDRGGSKSELIFDLKSKSKIFTAHHLLNVLRKHVTPGFDKDNNPINIIDMSFMEYVDFVFCHDE